MTRSTIPAALPTALLVVLVPALQAMIANRVPGLDLVLIMVIALAPRHGPAGGAVTGFAAGLLADLVPPADHELGRNALVLCLVGYLCGLSALAGWAGAVAGVLAAALLSTGLGLVLEDPRVSWDSIGRVLPAYLVVNALAAVALRILVARRRRRERYA